MGLFTFYLLKFAAYAAFILGALLIFFPKTIAKINQAGAKFIIRTDILLTKHRIITGVLLLMCGIFLLYLIKTIPVKL